MLKGLGNIAGFLKQAQQMGGRMQAINEQLKSRSVVGSSGGGMLTVEMNGLGEVRRVTIEPSLVQRGECELIEDLARAACNDARDKARQMHSEALQSLTGGVELPGMQEIFSKLGGDSFLSKLSTAFEEPDEDFDESDDADTTRQPPAS